MKRILAKQVTRKRKNKHAARFPKVTQRPTRPADRRWPDEIKVGKRHRRDLGDLGALALSISARGGLIHPPTITPANELIAGERRLLAWQRPECVFNAEPMPVTIFDVDAVLAGEADENDPALRLPFTPSEAVAIARALRPAIEAKAKERQREAGRSKARGKLPQAEAGKTRDRIAKATGKGARTLEKAEAIVEAAEREPEKFSPLVEAMDRTGRVNGPFKRLQNIRASDAIKAEQPGLPMRGPYRTGIIDPPWASEPDDVEKDHGARAYYPYPTMTPEQIAALPVPQILAPDASVWLWITNFHLMHGHHLAIASAWGLRPVALLTWIKSKWGQGQRVRGASEHILQLVRGDVPCLGGDTRSWFEGAGGAHSEKPQEIYAIIERLSPAALYFEMFSRGQPRDRWDLHGNEVGKLACPVTRKTVPKPSVTAP